MVTLVEPAGGLHDGSKLNAPHNKTKSPGGTRPGEAGPFLSPHIKRQRNDTSDQEDEFETRLELLASILEAVDKRSHALAQRASAAEQDAESNAQRLKRAEEAAASLRSECHRSREREAQLAQEVNRLRAQLEQQRLSSTLSQERYQQKLAEERLRADRAYAQRDDVVLQRDDALAELSAAYSDMDAMQATLADSAVFVRYLRRRVTQLEGMEAAASAELKAAQQKRTREAPDSVFSLKAIKASIEAAVQDAMRCDDAERKKRLRALQLRWHPDKNPVLREVATEVTKMINEAVTQLEGGR